MSTIETLQGALAGRYDISKEIGSGGMATVFLAHDVKHDRDVAIKVLHPDLGAALGSARFLSEIKTTAKLQHPHILPLLDSGEAGGLLYYVMPVVTGESLRVRIEREGQLSINEAIRIAKETASALDYAHRHGVIHRDIKPENILLHDGQAIVGDFGIALAVSAAGGARMTQTGLSLGTPQYMSPEQAMGERTVDARSDVYSLGAVTYEMLTGDAPFTGSSVQAIVSKIMTQRPTPISAVRDTVPESVEEAVMIALSKLPADRFATAAEFAGALTSSTASFGRSPSQTSAVGRKSPRRRKLDVIGQRVGIPAIGLALILGALALWGWMRPQQPKELARYLITLDSTNLLPRQWPRITLSPDGSTIVFVGGFDQKLFIRPRNSFAPIPIAGTEGVLAPFFSADGKHIAYTNQVFELRIVPVEGGQPVIVADSLVGRGGGAWSPDGFIYMPARLSSQSLYRVRPMAGGAPEKFTSVDTAAGEIHHAGPYALPNAKGILFVVIYKSSIKSRAIAVADTKTGAHRILMDLDGFLFGYSPSGHILLASPNGMMAVPFDESTMKITGEALPVLDRTAEIAASSNGTLIYAPIAEVSTELVWVTRAGAAQVVDSTWRGVSFGPLALSPDGRRLAVTVFDRSGARIWIKQLDYGPAQKLTLDGRSDGYPAWTPDGTRVSYFSDVRDVHLDLWLKKADASAQAVQLEKFRNPVESEWSPDGQWLIFRTSVQNGGKGDIFAIRPGRDSVPTPIVVTPFAEQYPAISPDGHWLAYASNETGRNEIYVVPFPNASSAKLPISSRGGTEPVWSRNGRELFYRDGAGNMVSVEIGSSTTFSAGTSKILFSARGYRSNP
nr:serine/threonine-protein kinase [Gemmatimonadaceae bacterium]